jgi:hypothetical protein
MTNWTLALSRNCIGLLGILIILHIFHYIHLMGYGVSHSVRKTSNLSELDKASYTKTRELKRKESSRLKWCLINASWGNIL